MECINTNWSKLIPFITVFLLSIGIVIAVTSITIDKNSLENSYNDTNTIVYLVNISNNGTTNFTSLIINDSYNVSQLVFDTINSSPFTYQQYEISTATIDLWDETGASRQVTSAKVLSVKAVGVNNQGIITTAGNYDTQIIYLYANNESGIALYRKDDASAKALSITNYSNESSAELFSIDFNLINFKTYFDYDTQPATNGFRGNLSFEYNATNQFLVYVEASVANQINYLGHSDSDTVVINDLVYFDGSTYEDLSAQDTNTTMTSKIIIEAPDLFTASDKLYFNIPSQNTDCSILSQNAIEGWFAINITDCIGTSLDYNKYFYFYSNFTSPQLQTDYIANNIIILNSTDNSSVNLIINDSVNLRINFTADTIPPSITINSPASNQWTTDNTPPINFTINDSYAATISYSIYVDGAVETSSSIVNNTSTVVSLNALVDGNHTVIIQATDNADNVVNSTSLIIKVDANAPYSTINSINNSNTSDTTPQISFTLNDSADSLIDYLIYVDNEIDVSGTANNNTLTSVNLSALTQGNHTIIVSATDEVNFTTNSTLIVLTVDTTNPVISQVKVNNINISDGGTIDITTPNATINFTITERYPKVTNVTLDGNFKNSSTNNGSLNTNMTLSAGKHSIVITTVDHVNNSDSYLLYIRVNTVINFTDTLNQTKNNLANVTKINISNGTGDLTFGVYLPNSTYNLTYQVNAQYGLSSAKLINFDGLNVNWNQTLNYSLNTDNTSVLGTTTSTNSGLLITHFILFNDYSNFLNTSDFDSGVIFQFNTSLGPNQSVIYIDDDEVDLIYKLSQCTGNVAPSTIISTASTACYTNNTNTTIYAPHFSGAAIGNDTLAPTVTLLNPADLSTESQGFFNINFTVSEYNPANNFCTWNISRGNTNQLATLTTSNFTRSGTVYTYNGSLYNQLNGVYGLNITCYDTAGRKTTSMTNYTVTDVTAPKITSVSAGSVDEEDMTLSWSTNERSNKSVQYGITANLGSNTGTAGFTSFTHAQEIVGLSADTTYYYNVTSCDINGNCNSSGPRTKTTDEAADAEETSTTTGGDNSGNTNTPTDSNTNTTTNNTIAPTTTAAVDADTSSNSKNVAISDVNLSNNELLLNSIKSLLAIETIDESEFEKYQQNTETIKADSELKSGIEITDEKSVITTSFKYTGIHKIKKLIVYDIIPKEFAIDADLITAESDSNTVVVKADPEFATIYYDVKPGTELKITYTIWEESTLSVLEDVISNVLVAELELVDTSINSESDSDARKSAIPWILGFIILVILGFIIYYYYMKNKESLQEDRILHLDEDDEERLKQLSKTPVGTKNSFYTIALNKIKAWFQSVKQWFKNLKNSEPKQ